MPMVQLKLRPGANVEVTPSLNEAGYSETNFGRFRSGLFEKVGGWDRYYPFAVGGVPKALHAWLDVNETTYLAVGTTTLLGTISDGDLTDLTPQTYTSDFAPDFTTTATSPDVTVDDPNISNVTDYDSVEFLTPVSVGGLILSGVYPIDLRLGTTTYRIIAAAAATGSDMNTGSVPVFTATEDSTTVSVLLPDHGMSVGSQINFPIETVLNVSGNDNYTKVLLHMNGADASTTFTDSNAGGSTHSWTAAGNAQIDTADFEFGGASGLFDGIGDYVTTPDSSDFTLGSGDFTVDLWFNCNAASGTTENIAGQVNAGFTASASAWWVQRGSDDKIYFAVSNGSSFIAVASTSTFTDVTNAGWHQVMCVRTGNILRLFIDGVQEGGDVAFSGSVPNSAAVLGLGCLGGYTTDPWTGWLDEFRLSVGIAREVTNFTPPVAEYGAETVSILGTYTAIAVADVDNFSIGISRPAGATGVTAMNGGLARLQYYIALGPTSSTSGYGIGTYGSGGYGTGSPAPSQQTGTPITSTDWTLDNWGEILLACPEGGGLYQWRPNSGLQNAELVSQAPIHNNGMFVSMQTQMVIAYGATANLTLASPVGIGVDQDPLLVAWCNNGDYTSWNPSTTSQAGSRRLPTGSKIVSGMSVPQQELLWTDLDLWSMAYLGSLQAGVWGFNKIGSSCGLIGKHAAARLGSAVYWMGFSNFFVLSGAGVSPIPCPVWDIVFQDINADYRHKSWAWANTPFNEVWYFFPRASTGAVEPDMLVKNNTLTGEWDYFPLDRSCGIDQSIIGRPISASSQGLIYEHEVSNNADGQPIDSWFVTGLFQLSDGQDMMLVDWFLPDFKFVKSGSSNPATISVTLYAYEYSTSTPTVHGPFTVTSDLPYFNPRCRGRFISMKAESNEVGTWFRLGSPRARVAPDGRL